MKIATAFGLMLAALATPAAATVLTFDDWPAWSNPAGYGPIGYEVGGIVTSASDPFYSHGVVSGNQALSSLGAGFMEIDFLNPMSLTSMYVTSLNPDSAHVEIIGGFRDDMGFPQLLASMIIPYNSVAPTLVTFGPQWNGLNYLWVNGQDDVYPGIWTDVTIDNLTFVPEPSTWAMMLLGFGAIGVALRCVKTTHRKQRRRVRSLRML